MYHQGRACSSCKKPNGIGCHGARLELMRVYDALKSPVPEQPHDLEGLNLNDMRLKIEKQLAVKETSRDAAVPSVTRRRAPVLAPLFSAAIS